VAYLECVHADGDTPIQVERRHVSLEVAPEFLEQDFTKVTASDYLLSSLRFTDAEHVIAAIAADRALSEHLEIELGAPCLELTRRTRLGDTLITEAQLIHPGRDFRLTGHLPKPAQAKGSLP
jgi:GntR family histidine utilization transcriptional repressor